MVVIGGLVDLAFVAWINLAAYGFGVQHIIAETVGMPVTWIANYLLNLRFTFVGQRANWRQFGSLVAINLVVWVPYFAASSLVIDVLHLPIWLGPIAGIGARSSFNIALQQIITFGRLAKVKKGTAGS